MKFLSDIIKYSRMQLVVEEGHLYFELISLEVFRKDLNFLQSKSKF